MRTRLTFGLLEAILLALAAIAIATFVAVKGG